MNSLNGFISIANAYRSLVLERIWVMRRDTRRVSETFPFSPKIRRHFAIRVGAESVTSLGGSDSRQSVAHSAVWSAAPYATLFR
jgi:hypothetical protein